MPSLTMNIKPGTSLHARIIDAVRDRIEFSRRVFQARHNSWRKNEEAALAFLPERDLDAARRVKREQGGMPEYTTIMIPYSYGVLLASHTYWTTVFLSRTPIMQFAGRHGEGEQQTQALEALIDYQVHVGGMMVPFYIWLLDVGKYGQGVIGTFWDEEVATIAEIQEVEEKLAGVIPTGKFTRRKITREVPGYTGNKIFNVRPFDFFPDPRVPVARFQDGEFCGRYFELGWNEVLRRRDAGFYTNTDRLRRDGTSRLLGAREAGSAQLELPATDDIFAELGSRKSADVVKGFECHVELVPSVWGLGKGEKPEKWVFTVTSDWEIVLGAQPLGAIHNKFPFHVIELEPEGYGLAPRGIPEILDPIQRTMDWLINSHFYNVRKTLNNQVIVDPSRIVMKDVLDPRPGGVIRTKPAAYGQAVADALHQLPMVDITRGHLADIQIMNQIGQRASGVNDQILGLLNSGSSRRTATEVRTSSSFGINRLKTSAEYFSAMGWEPLGQMLVQNSQQYYDMDRKFKIVGDLAQSAGQRFINVDPLSLSGFFDFVPVDGTLPADRFAQANLWRELLGQLRNFPQLLQQYDIGKIFSWVAQLAGLKNINQFKVQLTPDAVAAQQAQAGNVVPLGGSGAAVDATNPARVPTGQVSGLGPTG